MLWKCVRKEIRHPADAFRVKKNIIIVIIKRDLGHDIFDWKKFYVHIFYNGTAAGTIATHECQKDGKNKIIARSQPCDRIENISVAKKNNNLSSVLYASIFWPPRDDVYNTIQYIIYIIHTIHTVVSATLCITCRYNISVKTTT